MERTVVAMAITYRTPTAAEQIELTHMLQSVVRAIMWRLADRDLGGVAAVSADIEPGDERQLYLALLHSVGVLNALLDLEEKHYAKLAGHYGAGYPELAQAWRVSRQGARRRWPDAVPGRDDEALRQALAKLVHRVSVYAELNPRIAALLIGPITSAASAIAGGSTDDLVVAATRILKAAPADAADQGSLSKLLANLKTTLEAFESGTSVAASETRSPWQRFLAARGR